MYLNEFRNKLGKFILVSNIGIFFLIFLFYFLRGFTDDELFKLLRLLAPIKAMYLTTVLKYTVGNKSLKIDLPKDRLSSLYTLSARTILFTHILILTLVIVLSAFNKITFTFLINTISLLETLLGVYVGIVISDLFKLESKQKT